MATETKTFYPRAHVLQADRECSDMTNATNPVGKGSTNTTYASFKNYSNTYARVYWPFDTSTIPAEATIDSVTCRAKGSCNTTKGSMVLCVGSYAWLKGGSTTMTSDYGQVYELSCGTWTREELNNIRLLTRITNSYSDVSTFCFYGADLTIQYTVNNEKFMLKLGGDYENVARTFKKVSGIWVEQTDLANVIEDGVRYKNGGEYIVPRNTITVTGTGSTSNCYLTINGEKVTGAGSHMVDSGSVVACYISKRYYNDTATIVVDGTTVQNSTGTYNYTVNNDCTINLSVTGSTWSQTRTITITTS